MKVRRGNVVVLDYPYSDRTGSKRRPALVVATDAISQRTTDTIVVAISRTTHRASAFQFYIDPQTPDGRNSGLRHPSMVQCENLLTIDQQDVLGIIGELSPAMMQQIGQCLRAALNL
jgi:mRNA interferase MazF